MTNKTKKTPIETLAELAWARDYTRLDVAYGGGDAVLKAAWAALTDAERAQFTDEAEASADADNADFERCACGRVLPTEMDETCHVCQSDED